MPFGDRTGGAVCPGAAAPGTAETNRHTGTPLPGNAGFGNKSGCVSGTVSHAAMVAPLAALWQAADDALQILPESLTAACCAEILGKFWHVSGTEKQLFLHSLHLFRFVWETGTFKKQAERKYRKKFGVSLFYKRKTSAFFLFFSEKSKKTIDKPCGMVYNKN
jgi:hypothetical protein